MAVIIRLECEECGRRNYTTTKSKKVAKTKLRLKKYCPSCRKHTYHKEAKA